MKVLQFTIPVKPHRTISADLEVQPYFYPHLHRHQEIQLTWIQRGEGTLVAQTAMHAFWPNDIYLIGANQPHVFKSDPIYFNSRSRKTIKALTIFFNPDTELRPLLEFPEMQSIRQFLLRTGKGFKIPKELVTEISACMLRVYQSQGLDQLLNFINLLRAFTHISTFRPLVSAAGSKAISDFEGMRIGKIYNYIMQHFDKEIMLEDVAAHAHMTPQAFCKYFKKHTRHTFISFLNEVRINESCKILTEGNYESISTVAYRVGFNSITNFNRVFKTVTGKSPREYLREFSELR